MICLNSWRMLLSIGITLHVFTNLTSAADLAVGQRFPANDSLDLSWQKSEDEFPERSFLEGLCWKPSKFEVDLQEPYRQQGKYLVRFPSPLAEEQPRDRTVTMEWYPVENEQGQLQHAPAIVVVHESGRGMNVGRMFATALRKQDFHTFLIHLPGYGPRREQGERSREELVTIFHQAICDVRRARDAVAVLPAVDAETIFLQGTSLGGFVSASVAGLDDGYNGIFLMLAGGDLYDIMMNGKKDAAKALEKAREAGITDAQLKASIAKIEPLNLAPRMQADRVWLYSGLHDTVVPMKNANLLADAARLSKNHHVLLPANHYSGILLLPIILDHMGERMRQLAGTKP